jgi:hypothetical protein
LIIIIAIAQLREGEKRELTIVVSDQDDEGFVFVAVSGSAGTT